MAKQPTEIALVKLDQYAISEYTPETLKELVDENLEGDTLSLSDLQRAKVPAGGGMRWNVPSLTGEDDGVPTEILGVIIHKQVVRAYWAGSIEESGGGSPPDCTSEDNTTGIGNPGGECAECPYAQFGSKGAGQACKQGMRLFLLQTDSLLPMMIMLPPTSVKVMRGYIMGIMSKGRQYRRIVTSLSLEKATNKAGIDYARVVPSIAGILDDEAAANVKSYANAIKGSLSQIPITEKDYDTSAA